MSSPADELRSDDTIDATDLLGPDGTVDIGKVKTITNRRDGGTPVSPDRCRRIRERLASGEETATSVAADFGIGSTAVRNHARGKCSCHHGTPTVTYERGVGWSRDE